MIKQYFKLDNVHPSWQGCLQQALEQMDPHYLEKLRTTQSWLPGPEKIFSAFSLPLHQVNYLLLGESPYPRAASANGYAFWDAQVQELWSPEGMSKKVNRATSLRNLMKMLFVAEGLLKPPHCSQSDIAALDKSQLIHSNAELFNQLLGHGFLLLNASLVLQPGQPVRKDAVAWQPFLKAVIAYLLDHQPQVKLILLGRIAKILEKLLPEVSVEKLCAEHPYNHSFITNEKILQFFKPLHLLRAAC